MLLVLPALNPAGEHLVWQENIAVRGEIADGQFLSVQNSTSQQPREPDDVLERFVR